MGALEVRFISSNDQVVDGFTKPITSFMLDQLRGNLKHVVVKVEDVTSCFEFSAFRMEIKYRVLPCFGSSRNWVLDAVGVGKCIFVSWVFNLSFRVKGVCW